MSFWTPSDCDTQLESTQVEILMSFWTRVERGEDHDIYTSRDSNEFLDLCERIAASRIYTSRGSNEFLDYGEGHEYVKSTQVEILMSFWTDAR